LKKNRKTKKNKITLQTRRGEQFTASNIERETSTTQEQKQIEKKSGR